MTIFEEYQRQYPFLTINELKKFWQSCVSRVGWQYDLDNPWDGWDEIVTLFNKELESLDEIKKKMNKGE